jgi:hypothetical protein
MNYQDEEENIRLFITYFKVANCDLLDVLTDELDDKSQYKIFTISRE